MSGNARGRIGRTVALVIFASAPAVGAADSLPPVAVVSHVDLERYAGRWHEIARFPNVFQRQCVGDVTADYRPLDTGHIEVVNRCRVTDGGTIEARGVARLAEATGPTAKLEVTFAPAWLRWLPWVWAPYWVLDLGPDYSYALVGTPDRAYLWVLARTPFLDDASYSRVQATAREQGFDVARVVRSSPPVR